VHLFGFIVSIQPALFYQFNKICSFCLRLVCSVTKSPQCWKL